LAQATTIDFAAVGRVSTFAELKNVRLVQLSAICDPSAVGPVEAEFSNTASVTNFSGDVLDVACEYRFVAKLAQATAIEIVIRYLVTYAMTASSPLAESDLAEFARGNGVLHSWPFVREVLNSTTLRMGFPPFTLGVMHFVPQQPKAVEQPKQGAPTAAQPQPQAVEGEIEKV
jgi:preprotein translocase subunit SecB